jgi:hypothetical protein
VRVASASSDDADDGGFAADTSSNDTPHAAPWSSAEDSGRPSTSSSDAAAAAARAARLQAWREDVDVYTVGGDAPAPAKRFNTQPFAPQFVAATPPPVRERDDKLRPRARGGASAGRAAASSLVCAACAWGVNAAVFDAALPWADAKLTGDPASLPLAAAHDTVQAVLAGGGTMLLTLYGVYAVGLAVYAARRVATRGEPVVWHRCDGGDASCCNNKPAQAYLNNGRGFETENARAMAGHLRWRKGCKRAQPLIVRLAPNEETLW